jgi:hypothetical protein
MSGLATAGLFAASSLAGAGTLTLASAVHLTLLFGAFGGLEPVMESLFNRVFGEAKDAPKASEETQKLVIVLQQPEHEHGHSCGHCDTLEAQRAAQTQTSLIRN